MHLLILFHNYSCYAFKLQDNRSLARIPTGHSLRMRALVPLADNNYLKEMRCIVFEVVRLPNYNDQLEIVNRKINQETLMLHQTIL